MKKRFIVANWKSHKTVLETEHWFQEISNFQFPISNKEIIVCPSFTVLSRAKSFIDTHKLPIKLGAQDLSLFGEGSYTGEVNGKQIKEFADYVIVGHSERRTNCNETETMISKKIEQALDCGLKPIICISRIEQIINLKSSITNHDVIVAYEPTFAIGSGSPDTPENADEMGLKIRQELGDVSVLYGGSVAPQNVNSFTKMPHIDGVLVGKQSLDAQTFFFLIQNA